MGQLGISPEQLEDAESDLGAMLSEITPPSECDDNEDGGAPAIDLPKLFRDAGLFAQGGNLPADGAKPTDGSAKKKDKKKGKEEKKLKFLVGACVSGSFMIGLKKCHLNWRQYHGRFFQISFVFERL